MNGRRSFSSNTPCKRHGFTLIEVLLVTILSAVLMIGLWSLFGTYIRLFDSGPERTERAQLLRAIKQQFTDDLQGVMQISQPSSSSSQRMTFGAVESSTSSAAEIPSPAAPPIFTESASSESNLPRFGIIGTSQSLKVFTMQSAPSPLKVNADEVAPIEVMGESHAYAPELRAVVYSFTEPEQRTTLDDGPPPGLIRRDQDWQTAANDRTLLSEADSVFDLAPDNAEIDDLLTDESVTWIPEVTALQFRYFGEGVWQESWDSLQKKTLPSAVEIVIELDELPSAEKQTNSASSKNEEDVDEVDYDSDIVDTGLLDESEEHLPQYRFLIHLPGGVQGAQNQSFGSSFSASDPFAGDAP